MEMNGLDKRSFILGMVTAFSECVAAGCKRLALSPPLTGKDYERVGQEAEEIIRKHGLLSYHEKNEDRPEEGRFEWILIAGKRETLNQYAALRARGLSPADSLAPFSGLLSYDPAESVHTGYDAYRSLFPPKERAIRGLQHVSMKCADAEAFARARDFYTRVLGLSVRREWPEGILLSAGSGCVEIFRTGEGVRTVGAVRHFALAAEDVDALAARVREEGYEVFVGPKDVFFASDPPSAARMAFCIGPLGEQIEFFCENP